MTLNNASCNPRRHDVAFAFLLGVLSLFGIAASADEPGSDDADSKTPTAQLAPAALAQPHLPSDKIAAVFRTLSQAAAGREEPPNDSSGNSNADNDDIQKPDGEQKIISASDIAGLVDQLGWTEFAVREQATAKLREIGKLVLPALRQAEQEHPDLEVRMRAADVAAGIEGGVAAGRIDAFLAGQDVHLDGWEIARQILGDGIRIRELFVDFSMRHGNVAVALAGSSQQRADALAATIIAIQRGTFVERRLPTEADVIALLLLANDHDMPISNVEEDAIFTTLRREATSKLLSDAQLSGPFRALLGGWVSRDDVSNRQEMLYFSLTSDLAETLPLALNTLAKPDENPVTLAMALQAIARFGDQANIASVAKLLSDERPASEQQYSGGSLVQAQVRDAAAAAVILLSDRSLGDFDMNENASHPKYGFIVQEIGFPIDAPELRSQVIEKVQQELTAEKSSRDESLER